MEDYLMSNEEFSHLRRGDVITIRPDLNVEMDLPCGVCTEMTEHAGKNVTIEYNAGSFVRLAEVDWNWSAPMFISRQYITERKAQKAETRAYTDFKEGDLVKIREYEDLENNYSKVQGFILTVVPFNEDMKQFCGKEAVIQNIRGTGIAKIKIKGLKREEYSKYQFSTDMFEIVEEDYRSKQKEKEVKKVKITSKDIEKEMISKLDVAKIKKILASAFRIKATELKGVEPMLENWAKQKKDLYVLLGNQLKVTKEIEYEADEQTWKENIKQLTQKFPRYIFFITKYTDKVFCTR